MYTPLNSRDPYPLRCDNGGEDVAVFRDDGSLDPDFLSYVAGLVADARAIEAEPAEDEA